MRVGTGRPSIDFNGYRQAPSTSAVTSGKAELRLGDSGEAVRLLQRSLGVTVDGKFGAQTLLALDAAKTQHGLTGQAGRAGATTFSKLVGADRFNPSPTSSRVAAQRTSSTSRSGTHAHAPGNLTAKFEGTEKVGQTNQLKTGKITINGNTYSFTSGGWGRGNLPAGSYRVSGGVSTSESGMVVDGVGFKFNLSNKYDSRVGGATRSGLLIHPDGGSRGTAGCIGIVGNGAVQRRFAQDMKAELARRGGSFILNVG